MSDYIPPELIPNILARLPVEDVLRCTSVCKSWYELITSPSFASSHLKLSSPNQEPRLLFDCDTRDDGKDRFFLHRDNETFDKIAKFDHPLYPLHHPFLRIIGSLTGLFCFHWIVDINTAPIILWNPSLRKSLILPNSRMTGFHRIGFGFVATTNEYKILKLYFTNTNTNTEPQAEIYRLSTGSWSDVKLEGRSFSIAEPVHLNGIFHWFGWNPGKSNSDNTKVIRSFDLKNEKFGSIMVPSCLRHGDGISFFPWTFKESLCLIDETGDGPCGVWVMKEYGVSDSWQYLFVIDYALLDISSILYFRHNGEVISELTNYNSTLVSYDCNNKRGTDIKLLGNPGIISIHTYAESLALINIPNEVKIDEESTNMPKIIRGFSDLTLNRTNETEELSKIE